MKAPARPEWLPWSVGAALVALLAAFGLRLHLLAEKAVWWDEGWSVWLARQDFVAAALRTASDEHPPLHYWFLRVWTALAGEDAFAVRFSSVAFGVLTVALTYRLGKDLAGVRVALLGAALLTISRFHIAWSQEIKMYAPGVLLALLSCLAFSRLWRTGRRRYAALWAVSTWLCMMTLYLGVLVVLAQGVVALWSFLRTRRLGQIGFRQWLALQAVTAAAYLPWLWVYRTHAYPFESIESFNLGSALRLYATVLPLGISTDLDPLALPAIGFSALAALGALVGRGRPPQWRLLGLAVVTLPAALLLFSLPHQAIYQPKVTDRYMVLFLPLYLLLVAAGIEQMARLRWSLGAVTGLAAAGAMLVTLGSHYAERRPDREAPALAYAVASQMRPDDIVVLNADKNWPVYSYHLPVPEERWVRIPYAAAMSPTEADRWLRRLVPHNGAVWLINTAISARTDPRREVQRWLESHFQPAGDWRFLRSRVALYTSGGDRVLGQLPPQSGTSELPLLAQAGRIGLGAVSDLPLRLRPGEAAYVFSVWDALEPTARDYRARLRLVRQETGEERSRAWEPLAHGGAGRSWSAGETVLARHLLAVAPQQAPGIYDVMLDVERDGQSSAAPLGSVEVQAAPYAEASASFGERMAIFGDLAALLGVSGPAAARPGEPLTVQLQWQALAETAISYTVFVHLVGPDGAVWGSGDAQPAAGEMPTNGWTDGDLVVDRHTVPLPPNAPPGRYRLLVGLYDALSGQRLAAAGPDGAALGDNAAPAGEVEVLP